jgi:3-hydroxyacyl-CoA dehydrogenase
MSTVDYSRESDVAVLTIRHKPVNALSLVVREGLRDGLLAAAADEGVVGVVITGTTETGFIAGADVREFGTPAGASEPRLKTLQAMIEDSKKPVVAAINGNALGGGLEVALACHARVAAPNAKLGLPEVKLGLLPGAGGTVRTTRLCGPEAALDLIISGAHISAARAVELGLADEAAEDAVGAAVALVKKLAREGCPAPITARDDKIKAVPDDLFKKTRAATSKKARGAIAPMKIIDCIETACNDSAANALAFEAAAFMQLLGGPQNKALQYAFMAEREARKIPGVPVDASPPKLQQVAVIGAGLMGGGIAMVFANAGIPVRIIDVSSQALTRGRQAIERNYQNSVSRGSMSVARMEEVLTLISTDTEYEGLSDSDLVVEAVFENMELKRDIFARLDRIMPAHAILATNTSSLDIDHIAAATARPEHVIGAHFFSPANVMKLLEIVRGAKTSPATIGALFAVAKRINKIPVLAGNCDGFIGNRMLQYYTTEAEYMLEEGATPEQVDRVAESFGMAMGPLAMRDLAGMDTGVRIRAIRRKTLPPDERMPEVVERLVEAGRIGQKAGKGYYRYDGRTRLPDPEAQTIIEKHSTALGIKRRELSDDEVRDRLFMPLTNEGAKELEEGIALRASDIDVAWINGYGFPAHRGGPMFWGEQVGLERVLDMAERLGRKNGRRWGPGDLLKRLAKQGGRFGT